MIMYDEMTVFEKDIIEEAMRLMEKADEPEFTKDEWSSMLLEIGEDINLCQPITGYSVHGYPVQWRPLLMMGIKKLFYFYMIDKYVEVPELINMHGAYANLQTLMDRWEKRYDKLAEKYELEKKKFKWSYYLPGMRLTIDNYAYGLPPVGPVLARPGYWHP